jgi:hypothetical protein
MDKQCSKCGVIKNINDFYKSQRGTKCRECTLQIGREYKKNKRMVPEFRKNESKKQKERRVRLWQNTLLNDSNKRNVIREIDVDFINELYEKQNGLCYWFKIPLTPSTGKKHPQQPSLDRLDRNKGYTKDNVVLTCYAANIGRNENDVETWSEFLNVLFQKK